MEHRVNNHTELAEAVYKAYAGYFKAMNGQVYIEEWDELDLDEQAAWHCAVASCVRHLSEEGRIL
jgi:hypothetical protein